MDSTEAKEMKRLIIIIAILLASCTIETNNIFSLQQSEFLETENATVSWHVIDNRLDPMNYYLLNDGKLIANGTMLNDTIIELNIIMNISKSTRLIELYVIDKGNNTAYAFATVNVTDKEIPQIIFFEISKR